MIPVGWHVTSNACFARWGVLLSGFRVMWRCVRRMVRRCGPVRSAYCRANPMRGLARGGVLAFSVGLGLSGVVLFWRVAPLIHMPVVFRSPFVTLVHGLSGFPVGPCSCAGVCGSPGGYSTGLVVLFDGRIILGSARAIVSCGMSDGSRAIVPDMIVGVIGDNGLDSFDVKIIL